MAERARRYGGVTVVAVVFAAPLVVLLLEALADVWRAPSILPTELGSRGFAIAFGGAGGGGALINSIVIALGATAISLVIGWPAARALGRRGARFRGVVWTLVALPLLMPPYLAGFGLTEWFIRLGIDGTLIGVVAAHVTFTLPYVILVLTPSFGPEVESLEEMAATAGTKPSERLLWVTIPVVAPALAVATLLSFIVSWSQYGTSLAIGAGLETLPVVMLPFVGADPQVAAALAVVFLIPPVLALVAATRIGRSAL